MITRRMDVLNGPTLPMASKSAPLEGDADDLARQMPEAARLIQALRESVLELTERMLTVSS